MAITDRDMSVLTALGTFRVMTASQIRRYFFNGLDRALVQRRLGRLRAQGVLRSFPFGPAGELAWTLTTEGARVIDRPSRIFLRPPNRNTLLHDLSCVEVGLRLNSMKFLSDWVGAAEIESRSYSYENRHEHIPDAVFRLKIGSENVGPVGLEVEQTLKTRERIREVVRYYESSRVVTDLWFFWNMDWMGRALEELKVNDRINIWVAERSLSSRLTLRLRDREGRVLDLEELSTGSPQESDPPSATGEGSSARNDAASGLFSLSQ